MNTKIIYRITDINGEGVYQALSSAYSDSKLTDEQTVIYEDMVESHRDDKHPVGYFDGIYHDTSYFYAFPSMEKLAEWFEDYILLLDSVDYVIKVFETTDYIVGVSGKQVVFKLSSANLVSTLQISEAFSYVDRIKSVG